MKKLSRSKSNRVVLGVCGGVGAYFDVDPVAIRLIILFLSIFTALIPGIIFYLIAAVVMPEGEWKEFFKIKII